MLESKATKEHQQNHQADLSAEVSQLDTDHDLDQEHQSKLILARWAHDSSGQQEKGTTYQWQISQYTHGHYCTGCSWMTVTFVLL